MANKKRAGEYANFKKAVKKVLTVTKHESDEQMERLQARVA